MFSKLASLAVASCLCVGGIAQQIQDLEYNIPAEEALDLSQIVEEEKPPLISAQRKGKDESPEFPLIYRMPLPIPPVKQPKQYALYP